MQVELGQLGVVGDEGGCEDESLVWEEQLQQELQDMELQVPEDGILILTLLSLCRV